MRLPLGAVVGLVVAAHVVGAQEPPPQKPELSIPVSTEVVRLDVVVTDKGGKARQGLKREDFVVLEDGQPQAISQFEAFVVPAAAATPVTTPAAPAVAEEKPATPPQPTPRRFVVVAVDDIHIDPANLVRVKKTLDRFLEREVPPEDMVALVTTSGTRSQDFTEDRHTLREAAARLTSHDRRPRQVDVPYITEYQAELIERGDPEALQVAIEEIVARRSPAPNAEQEARAVARAVAAESIDNSRITLGTLNNVVRAMTSLRGRKVVVLVSDGFTFGLGVEGRAAYDLRQITDAGMRAGVIVYALDSRGLQANLPGWSASNRGPVMTAGGGNVLAARDQIARAGEFATQDAMNALAVDTGGFLVANTNDFSHALGRIMKDTEAYYLLAYEPSNARRDGAFRKIEVRLPGLKDARIRHRKGYFGPDDSKQGLLASASAARAAGASVPAPEDRIRAEMKAALASPAALRGLPVSLSADFVSVDSAAAQLVVSGYVDLRDVPFARTGERRLATVDVAGAVYDETGAEVGSLAVERATLDLTDAAYERALDKGLPYQRAATVKPGRYRVSVAVREDGGGKVGNAMQWVEIPDLGQGKLTLSSLFLMKEDASPRGTPSSGGPGAPLRPVQAHRVYSQDESLYVQFFAYNVGEGSSALVSQTEIWIDGGLLAASPKEPMAPRGKGAAGVAHSRKIKLRPFAPGEYEVRIVLTDAGTNMTASQRAAFTIE